MTRTLRLLAILCLAVGLAGLRVGAAHAATTLTVSTCDESHLVSAVSQANSDNAGDTITFSCSGTITLTSTLYISGSMTIDGSGQNVVIDGGHQVRIFLVNPGVSLGLNYVTLQHGNSASNPGGAILGNYDSTLTISNSTVSGNSASYSYGGAISCGSVTISNSTFSGNSAGLGGAIDGESGPMTITNSTFSGNSAGSNGGAIYSNAQFVTATITNSTLSGNSAGSNGGAIDNNGTDTTATITNSTLSGNAAQSGGAISNEGITVSITSSTLSGNAAPQGAAIYNNDVYQDDDGNYLYPITLRIAGTIIADSSGGNCVNDTSNGPVTIVDAGYNLEWTGSTNTSTGYTCGFSAGSDITGQDPQLGPLTNNGGPIQTMALASTSPAVDVIPTGAASLCPTGGTDQRGFSRPDNGESSCDIGAYEYQDPPDTIPPTSTASAGAYALGTWSTGSVTVTLSAQDNPGGSGVASTRYLASTTLTNCPAAGNSGYGTYSSPVTLATEGTSLLCYYSVDNAGNVESVKQQAIKIDLTNPTVTCATPQPVFLLHQTGATVSASVADGVSGPAQSTVSGPATTSHVGTFSGSSGVSLTGYDNAGRSTTVSCPYSVHYKWSGFSQPINDPVAGSTPMSVFKAGSTIPVKFQLRDASSTVVQAGSLPLFSVSALQKCADGTVDESVSTATPDTSPTYRWDSTAQQYVYNYKSPSGASGMCQFIQATLDDGTTQSVYIGYR